MGGGGPWLPQIRGVLWSFSAMFSCYTLCCSFLHGLPAATGRQEDCQRPETKPEFPCSVLEVRAMGSCPPRSLHAKTYLFSSLELEWRGWSVTSCIFPNLFQSTPYFPSASQQCITHGLPCPAAFPDWLRKASLPLPTAEDSLSI